MKASVRAGLLIATVLVTVPVRADAPDGLNFPNRPAQYDAFVNTTPTIHDVFTDLTWERFASRTKRGFAIAQTNCASSFSGRLPSVKELLTIVDEDPHNFYDTELAKTLAKAIDQRAFGTYTYVDAAYWTSTPTGQPDEVWGVSFADGSMVRLKTTTDSVYVRCVR